MDLPRIVALAGWLPLVTSCAIVGGEPLPLAAGKPTVCVERHTKDDRNLAALIDTSLRDQGFSVVTVVEGQCDPAVALRVAYVDNFAWDLRVYLLRLTVEIFDNRSGESLAIGESCQPSLAALGDSYEDVADRAVQALLGKEPS